MTASVFFFGVVRPRDLQPVASSDAADVAWYNIKKLPKLAFDHKKIIDVAIKRLICNLSYEPVGFELLDKEFPFSDLVRLYETLLDKKLDRPNFRKKLMSLGLVEQSDRVVNRGAGRPAKSFLVRDSQVHSHAGIAVGLTFMFLARATHKYFPRHQIRYWKAR